MSKNEFFLCKEPTIIGGDTYWGIRLGAIECFSFTPELPRTQIQFEDGTDVNLFGEDALRLMQAMGLEAAITFLPSPKPADERHPVSRGWTVGVTVNRPPAIELPEPSWDCPLGTGNDRCTDLSECERYQKCAETEDGFSPEVLVAAKILGISPGEVLRRAEIVQGDEDVDVCPLGPGDIFCNDPMVCEKYNDCVDAARELNRNLGLLEEDDDDD